MEKTLLGTLGLATLHDGYQIGQLAATRRLYGHERIALDVALAAGGVPNGVTDEMFAKLREHWSDGQIVEIVATIALFGFLNRWNDTFATPIEDDALAVGEKHLAPHGWEAGRHLRSA